MKILILGSYHGNNKGDEIIFYSLFQRLNKVFDKPKITVVTKDPDYFHNIYGVDAVKPEKLIKLIKILKNSDLVIIGGGGLFFDYGLLDTLKISGKSQILYWLMISWVANFYKKDILWYSVGFGPINTRFSNWALRKSIKLPMYITTRDNLSQKLVLGLGRKDPIESRDCVFGLNLKNNKNKKANKIITLFPRYWKNKENSIILRFKEIISYGLEDGYGFVISCTNSKTDMKICERIYSSFKSNSSVSFKPLKKNDSLKKFNDLLTNSRLIVTMRMHPVILASLSEIPSIAIEYNTPKIVSCMNELGLSKYCLSLDVPIKKTLGAFRNLINDQGIKKEINHKLKQIRKLENENENVIRKFN